MWIQIEDNANWLLGKSYTHVLQHIQLASSFIYDTPAMFIL